MNSEKVFANYRPAKQCFNLETKLEQLLSKEFQYKNSDQGKYYSINHVYEPWYLEHLDTMTHLEVLNIFNEKNNFE